MLYHKETPHFVQLTYANKSKPQTYMNSSILHGALNSLMTLSTL
jgi:hypothetical protein